MKVLCLHRRLSGYYIASLCALLERDVTLQVVARPNQSDAPFADDVLSQIGEVQNRHDLSDGDLLAMALDFNPDVVLVAGWSDPGYLKVCKALKATGVLIVSGCDTQWKGSLRQHLASLIAPWHIQKFIDVFWVSGERQRQLVSKLGFAGDRCWDGYYACDWNLFSAVAEQRFQSQRAEDGELRLETLKNEASIADSQPSSLKSQASNLTPQASPLAPHPSGLKSQPSSLHKSFAFVGRYVQEKGLDTLAEAYRLYSERVDAPWKLICAGKGPCREELVAAGAEDRGFVQPSELPQFFTEASAFILPSRFEPWGVVVQEAAATGLPVIVSDACGAGVHLLRDRWNGRSFAAGKAAHLADCMLWMHQQSDAQLEALSRNSFELSKQYTPERWARTLVEGVDAWKAET